MSISSGTVVDISSSVGKLLLPLPVHEGPKTQHQISKKFSRGFPGLANLRRCSSAVWHPARSSLHSYSLGRERAKANRDFEKPLAPALSPAAADLGLLMARSPPMWR
jgi:hypothetical protein